MKTSIFFRSFFLFADRLSDLFIQLQPLGLKLVFTLANDDGGRHAAEMQESENIKEKNDKGTEGEERGRKGGESEGHFSPRLRTSRPQYQQRTRGREEARKSKSRALNLQFSHLVCPQRQHLSGVRRYPPNQQLINEWSDL